MKITKRNEIGGIITDTILKILKDLHPEIDYETCITLVDDKILNSFDIISLISEIQDQMGVTITAAHILPQHFNSARAIYALVQKLEED